MAKDSPEKTHNMHIASYKVARQDLPNSLPLSPAALPLSLCLNVPEVPSSPLSTTSPPLPPSPGSPSPLLGVGWGEGSLSIDRRLEELVLKLLLVLLLAELSNLLYFSGWRRELGKQRTNAPELYCIVWYVLFLSTILLILIALCSLYSLATSARAS